jgi:hypothetical protein
MSKIQIVDLNVNSEELKDLYDEELNVQGGILQLAIIAFAAGYGAGSAARHAFIRYMM